jgi:hypothetical protein
MNADQQARATSDAANALANEVAAFLTLRDVPCAVALLAMAKLLGQGAAQFGAHDPEGLLQVCCDNARDEMRMRRTALALRAAGLGALMPVSGS